METDNPYLNLLYKRGFVLADRPVNSPHTHWPVRQLPGYWLCYDPLNSLTVVEHEDRWCALLGMVIDVFDPELTPQQIVSNLVKHACSSYTAFLDYLDYLNGRFILILGDRIEARLYQDACGMRSVFYSTEHCLVSSHLDLLSKFLSKAMIDENIIEYIAKYSSYHLPGFFTPIQNTRILTPNTSLNLSNRQVERFFPREPLSPKHPDQVFDTVDRLLSVQADLLSRNFQLMVSLTAGLDSRTTLALFKKVRDQVLFFTYFKSNESGLDEMNSDVLQQDKKIAQEIATNLDLHHILIELDYQNQDGRAYQQFQQVMNRNTYLHHNHYLAKEYLDKLPHDRLHIRSNINEIFRNFYQKQIKTPMPAGFPPETMAFCYSNKARHDEKIQEYFAHFAAIVGFDEIYNYDPFDMFYWEYRLGHWHANLLLESDNAHNTYCLFNNRIILKTILSLPRSLLAENYILHRLIDKHWPLLRYWPINFDKKGDELFSFGEINLEDGEVFASTAEGDPIPFYITHKGHRALFYIDVNAPKKGDHLVFRKRIPVETGSGYLMVLGIQSPYERRKLRGRMEYLVKLDGVEICYEDIADWSQLNLIQIVFQAQSNECVLEVEIRALRDCETWNWGRAAKVVVQSVSLQEIDYYGKTMATHSSPFTKQAVEKFPNELIGKPNTQAGHSINNGV